MGFDALSWRRFSGMSRFPGPRSGDARNSILTRAYAYAFAELFGELEGILIADHPRDFGDLEMREAQELLGFRNAELN